MTQEEEDTPEETPETPAPEDEKQDESSEQEQTEDISSEEVSEETSVEAPETETLRYTEVNGETKNFTLQHTFQFCPIVDTLNTLYTPTLPYSFADIQNSLYRDTIQQFRDLNLVHGTTDGNFEPTREITRVEFTKLVLLSHCHNYEQEDTTTPLFTDLTPNTWEARVARKARELGIIHGYQDNSFQPKELITKAEALKILLRMAYIQTDKPDTLGYIDITTQWHTPYIEVAQTL